MTWIDEKTRATAVELAGMFDIYQRDYRLKDEQIDTDPLRYETNRDVFMFTFFKVKDIVGSECDARHIDPRKGPHHAFDVEHPHSGSRPRPIGELQSMWRLMLEVWSSVGTMEHPEFDTTAAEMWGKGDK